MLDKVMSCYKIQATRGKWNWIKSEIGPDNIIADIFSNINTRNRIRPKGIRGMTATAEIERRPWTLSRVAKTVFIHETLDDPILSFQTRTNPTIRVADKSIIPTHIPQKIA